MKPTKKPKTDKVKDLSVKQPKAVKGALNYTKIMF
jgi:hypothetical protein